KQEIPTGGMGGNGQCALRKPRGGECRLWVILSLLSRTARPLRCPKLLNTDQFPAGLPHGALVPKPTIRCLAAIFDMFRSLNDLVGAGEQCRGYVEADRLRRLHVYDKLISGRELNGQFAHLGPSENTVNIGRGAAKLIDCISTIRNEAPFGSERPLRI